VPDPIEDPVGERQRRAVGRLSDAGGQFGEGIRHHCLSEPLLEQVEIVTRVAEDHHLIG
jgi:hypothetical protein